MADRAFIVTGGLRGLGRAMVLGLANAGYKVFAVGHIESDVARLARDIAAEPWRGNIATMAADIRDGATCDAAIAAAQSAFGRVDGLVNNAGLTFTFIDPQAAFGRPPLRFWEIEDRIYQDVMDTNFVAAGKMARRIAPLLIAQGWGRIVNVTTMLRTMNRPGSTPYGPSKAALEMASEVWASELTGTGVTVNILNPGAGAHTEGMADSLRRASREGKTGRFIEPEEMVPPLLWLVSAAADAVNGMRFDALTWDTSVTPAMAAEKNGIPAGFNLKTK